MERFHVALVGAFALIVLVLGLVLVAEQRETSAHLEEIACLERIHATAAVTALVPDANVDLEGRLDAVRLLSEQLDAC